MKKFNVLVSYVCEAEGELQAIFALNKTLFPLEDFEINKFEAFEVEEIK